MTASCDLVVSVKESPLSGICDTAFDKPSHSCRSLGMHVSELTPPQGWSLVGGNEKYKKHTAVVWLDNDESCIVRTYRLGACWTHKNGWHYYKLDVVTQKSENTVLVAAST